MTTALRETDQEVADTVPDNPLAILQDALARGTDPDKLGKLMDLAERYKSDRAAEQFATAMNECQRSMPCVVKDAVNGGTSSRYATLENVMTVIKPVYLQNGFSLVYGTADSPLAGHTRIVCDVSHVGGCTRRSYLDLPADAQNKAKSGIQAMGSTVSYGRRYLALMIFNVTVANQDVDGNRADALETITETDVFKVEQLLDDKKVHLPKFLEWLKTSGSIVGDEAKVSAISQLKLAFVLDMLARKKGPGEK